MNKADYENILELFKEKIKTTYEYYRFSQILHSINQRNYNDIQPYQPKIPVFVLDNIKTRKGISEWEICRKVFLLECLLFNWDDFFSEKYPLSVQAHFRENLERFLNMCQSDIGWGKYKEDVYWKDLAMARQKMFPAGPSVIDVYSGFGYRQGISKNISQSIRFLKLVLKSGKEAYYQLHLHIPLSSHFHMDGWINCYQCLGEMLMRHENIRGVFGASWFRDPQMETISPRLFYLHKIPSENGAIFFHIGEDPTGNAFSKSKTRLDLYIEGKYRPQNYLMVWPRDEIIRWTRADKSKNIAPLKPTESLRENA